MKVKKNKKQKISNAFYHHSTGDSGDDSDTPPPLVPLSGSENKPTGKNPLHTSTAAGSASKKGTSSFNKKVGVALARQQGFDVESASDSDDCPPALVPLSSLKHTTKQAKAPQQGAQSTKARKTNKKAEKAVSGSDDDEPPPLVPLNGSGSQSEFKAATPKPFAGSMVPVPVAKAGGKVAKNCTTPLPLGLCTVVANGDDMSIGTSDEEDEDEDEDDDSYYTDSDYYEVDGDEDEDENEEDTDDGENDDESENMCACATCQREQREHRRAMEEKAVLKRAKAAEEARKLIPTGPGTRTVKFHKTVQQGGKRKTLPNGKYVYEDLKCQTITAMAGYANKSIEELRFEDYAIDDPKLMKIKTELDAELADRVLEGNNRASMAASEVEMKKWAPLADAAWEKYLTSKKMWNEKGAITNPTKAHLAEVSKLLTEALETCASGAHAMHCHFLRAKCALTDKPHKAMFDLGNCIKFDKLNAEAHYLLGMLTMKELKDYEKAEKIMTKALRLKSSLFFADDVNGERSGILADCRIKAEEQKILRMAEIKKTHGNTALLRQSFTEAEQLYTEAIDLCPTAEFSHIYYCNRATARCEIGLKNETSKATKKALFESAVEDCDASLRLKPDYTKAMFRGAFCKGEACFLDDDFDGAMVEFVRANTLNKDNKMLQFSMKKTKVAISAIESKRKATEDERLIAEKEILRAEEKEKERKAMEEKRLHQERIRREKAEKNKADAEARAIAKQERDAAAKDLAEEKAREKAKEKADAKSQKDREKAEAKIQKEAEKEAKRREKEQEKEKAKMGRSVAPKPTKVEKQYGFEFASVVVRAPKLSDISDKVIDSDDEETKDEKVEVATKVASTKASYSVPTAATPKTVAKASSANKDTTAAPASTSTTAAPAPAPARKAAIGANSLSAILGSVGPQRFTASQRKAAEVASEAKAAEAAAKKDSMNAEIEREQKIALKYAKNEIDRSAAAIKRMEDAIRTEFVIIENVKVGSVIGTKGAIINEIMKRSGAKMIINTDVDDMKYRKVVITGKTTEINEARPLLAAVMAGGPSALQSPETIAKYKQQISDSMNENAGSSETICIAGMRWKGEVEDSDAHTSSMDVCIVCCEPIDGKKRLHTFGSCDHSGVCSLCTLRMRLIGKDCNCPICRKDLPMVVANKTVEPFQAFLENLKDRKNYEIFLQSFLLPRTYLKETVEKLFAHNCPRCSNTYKNAEKLRMHLQISHNLKQCELCVEHKQVFPAELDVYSPHEYAAHLRGTQSTEKTAYKGHPSCSYCKVHFYDKGALYKHVQSEHHVCLLCVESGTGGNQNQAYYRDSQMLAQHYKAKHYTCDEPGCVAANGGLAAFRSLFDLQAHKRTAHPISTEMNYTASATIQPPTQHMNNHMQRAHNPHMHEFSEQNYSDNGNQFSHLNQHDQAAFPPPGASAVSHNILNIDEEFPELGAAPAPAPSLRDINRAAMLPPGMGIDGDSSEGGSGDAFRTELKGDTPPFAPSSRSRSGSAMSDYIGFRGSHTGFDGDTTNTLDNLGSAGGIASQGVGPMDSYAYHMEDATLPTLNMRSGESSDDEGLHERHHSETNTNALIDGFGKLDGLSGSHNALFTLSGDLGQAPLGDFHLPVPADNSGSGSGAFGHSGLGFTGLLGADDVHGGSSGFFGSSDPVSAFGASALMSQSLDDPSDALVGGNLPAFLSNSGESDDDADLPSLDQNDPSHTTSTFGVLGLYGDNSRAASLDDDKELLDTGNGLDLLKSDTDVNVNFNELQDENHSDEDENEDVDDAADAAVGSIMDCCRPVHDLPHDHFHELDEVSASNAAIIRSTFAPEFIDRLVGVLRDHPEGILGSAFPEAYRKMYGQRLILETKRGKKIKLLSVLEGHPNFYKSGMRVGGLKLHYRNAQGVPVGVTRLGSDSQEVELYDDDESTNSMSDMEEDLMSAISSLNGSVTGGASNSNNNALLSSAPSSAFDAEDGKLDLPVSSPNAGGDGAANNDEPGLEVDLLGPEAFPNMAWLDTHGMHMYRWAGNEVEWTEYALNLTADVLPYINAEPTSQSLLSQLAAESGCDLSIQQERLNGSMGNFLVLVRGSTGQPSNACMQSALVMISNALESLLTPSAPSTPGRGTSSNNSTNSSDGATAKLAYKEPNGVHVGKIGADGRTHTVLDVPQSAVSIIKGNAGKKLNLIRKKSGAFVNLITKFKGKGPAKLNISGTPAAVNLAIILVKEVIASGNNIPNTFS